jgi:hypothetical protein
LATRPVSVKGKRPAIRKRPARVTKTTHLSHSPIVKPSRTIPPKTSLFLYVHAGGRCEFDGCNKYLLEHYPTQTPGNFAEQAHIYAFKETGPRGDRAERPADINDLSNLMLLCPECHHLIDVVRPDDYPVEVLRRFKHDHEDRNYALTALAKDRDTVPLVLKALVAGRAMDISNEEMQNAVAPNYLVRRQKVEIDLTTIPDSAGSAYWDNARATIDRQLDQLARIEPRPGRTLRVSVFALAPIPLLIYLGARLSDKQVVDLYQRHRDPESWSWHEGAGDAHFATQCAIQAGGDVALLVNVSGQNTAASVTRAMSDCTVYELAVSGQAPTPLVLKTRGDLDRFTSEYIRALAMIRAAHPSLKRLHVLPAVPAPLAIVMGRMRLPKVDPRLLVYDRDQRSGGFVPTFEIS